MPKGDIEILKADTEDGYTKIANLIIEALAMCKLSGTQHGICLFLFRRTYGWGKAEDAISLPEFAAACDTSQPYISRQLKDLLEKNIIFRVNYQPGKTPVYTFNTRVAEWDKGCINVQGLSEQIRQGLYECARVGLSDCARVNQEPTLEPPVKEAPVKKELKKKKEINIFPADSPEMELATLLYQKTLEHYPNLKEPDMQGWAKHIDLLIRIDNKDPSEIKSVILWTKANSFWKPNIMSTDKLRKQYDQLNAKRIEEQNRGSPSPQSKLPPAPGAGSRII